MGALPPPAHELLHVPVADHLTGGEGAGGKKLVEKECLRKFKRISAPWRMFSLSTDYIDHVYIVHVGNMLEEYFEKAT